MTLSLLFAIAAGFVLVSCGLALLIGMAICLDEPEAYDYFEPEAKPERPSGRWVEGTDGQFYDPYWPGQIVAGPDAQGRPTLPLGGGDSSPAMSDTGLPNIFVGRCASCGVVTAGGGRLVLPEGEPMAFCSQAHFVRWVRETYVEAHS